MAQKSIEVLKTYFETGDRPTQEQFEDLIDSSHNSVIYDGINTEANILALDPQTYIGQVWWASDSKHAFKAVYSDTISQYYWAGCCLEYNSNTDTYQLKTTYDGQTQNIGQEIFFVARNDNGATASVLHPKVFISGGVTENPDIKSVTLAKASDIDDNKLYGVNTTQANIGGYTKITTYGDISDVDTSLWDVGDLLYVDPITEGGFTNVAPNVNAFPIAMVTAVGATAGKLFINSISAHDIASSTVTQGNRRFHFTGETISNVNGTFYLAKVNDVGTVSEATQTKAVDDNTIDGIDQDHLGEVYTTDLTIPIGIYNGQIEYEVNTSQANEKLYIEVYLADSDGGVTASNSGLPIGDLGVDPFLVLESVLLNSTDSVVYTADLRGYAPTEISAVAGQRVRFHILVEKVGTQGGVKTFTIYYGLSHSTFVDGVTIITSDTVKNNSDVEGSTVTDALNNLAKVSFNTVSSPTYSLINSDLGRDINVTATSSITLSDNLDNGFWCNIVRKGDGLITLTASSLHSVGTQMATKYTSVRVVHEGSNIWGAYGDLT